MYILSYSFASVISIYPRINRDALDSWRDLIVHISIQYPLPEIMKDVRIIDSPGVNAFGQVGELTEDYIEKANAVVFIKCLPGSALESKPFIQFLKSKNGGRCKEALFLLLSRISDLSSIELKEMLGAAHRLYDSRIAKEKILPIDSKIQLYYNKLAGKSIDDIAEIMDAEEDSGQTFPWIGNLLGRLYREKITHEDFDQRMCDMSGFKNVRLCFEEYARRAQKIALHDLCKNMSDNYGRIISELKHGCELKQKQLEKSPADYEFEIKERQNKLDELLTQLHEVIDDVKGNFTQSGGIIEQKKESVVADIKEILNDPTLDFNALEGKLSACTDSLKTYASEIAKEFIKECNSKLSAKCSENDLGQFMADIVIPDISTEEITAIKKKAEDENTREVTEGVTFTETKRRLDNDGYRKCVVKSISDRFDDIVAKLEFVQKESLQKIADKYRGDLAANINVEQRILEETLAKKENAETLISQIKSIHELISGIEEKRSLTEKQGQDLANGLKIN